jgi:hypothetical protein
MPNRSTKDEIQGTLHRFAQSMGLSPKDEDTTPPADKPPPPANPLPDPSKSGIAGAAQKIQGQQSAIDKAISDAGG